MGRYIILGQFFCIFLSPISSIGMFSSWSDFFSFTVEVFNLTLNASESELSHEDINLLLYNQHFKEYLKFLTTIDHKHYVDKLSDQKVEELFLLIQRSDALDEIFLGKARFISGPDDYPSS